MIQLPHFCHKKIKDEFSGFSCSSLDSDALKDFATRLARVFNTRNVICAVETSNGKKFTEGSGDGSNAEEFVKAGIHKDVLKDISTKLSPVSYSSFSWPYAFVEKDEKSNENQSQYLFPAEYGLIVPISSSLLITLDKEDKFIGYLAVFFDTFPKLTDDLVELFTGIGDVSSQIIAAILRENSQ